MTIPLKRLLFVTVPAALALQASLLVLVNGCTRPAASDMPPVPPFPVDSVPVPPFPELGRARVLPQKRAAVLSVDVREAQPAELVAGAAMRIRVYVPLGKHAPRSLGCVLVAPAGTNLLHGSDVNDDYHAETLPYVQAGMVVVHYSIDGASPGIDQLQGEEYHDAQARAYRRLKAAHAGVVNGRNALEFVLARLPIVDPNRIYCAGHSSAGTLALLLAAHEPRIRACIAYAPITDVEQRLAEISSRPEWKQRLPGLATFLKKSSPLTHVERLRCPVFVFHAVDDGNEPFERTSQFVSRLRELSDRVQFDQVDTGGHYDAMIEAGIPAAIVWLQRLPGEQQAQPAVAGL